MTTKEYKGQISEASIQTEILNWLVGKGYYTQRMNAGAIPTVEGRLVMLARKGTGDILIGIPVNGVYAMGFIEVKSAKGKLTIHQEMFQMEMQQRGILYIVARSLEDAKNGINDYIDKVMY